MKVPDIHGAICDSGTQKAEAEGLQVGSRLSYIGKSCLKTNKTTDYNNRTVVE